MGVRHVEDFSKQVQAQATGPYFVVVDNEEKPWDKKTRTFRLIRRKDKEELAKLSARSLPGCCGVCLLYGFSGALNPTAVYKLVVYVGRAAVETGYGSILLTLRENSPIISLLEAGGYLNIPFLNGKTGNRVSILQKDLGQTSRLGQATDSE